MSRAVDADLYELISDRNRIIRYLELIFRTWTILHRKRPKVVFAQNPSIVLSTLTVLFKEIYSFKLIIDEHNAGLFPAEGQFSLLNWLARWIARKADLILVTNESLSSLTTEWGANPFVMPDPLPDLGGMKVADSPAINCNPINILCICKWASDEPVEKIIEAASYLSKTTHTIQFTGKPPKEIRDGPLPGNIKLLGFISDHEYFGVLTKCDAVIVLTNRDDCLNCGAYEAVSAEKPGIISKSKALINYFDQGFLYVDNTVEDILSALKALRENKDELKSGIIQLKNKLKILDYENIERLNIKIDRL